MIAALFVIYLIIANITTALVVWLKGRQYDARRVILTALLCMLIGPVLMLWDYTRYIWGRTSNWVARKLLKV